MIVYQSDVCTDRFIISIEGHAGAAPRGADIVCSAASMLALTLASAVKRLDGEGEISRFSSSISKGSVQLDFTVKRRALEKVSAIVDTITEGYMMLEENYPEYVSVG